MYRGSNPGEHTQSAPKKGGGGGGGSQVPGNTYVIVRGPKKNVCCVYQSQQPGLDYLCPGGHIDPPPTFLNFDW